MNNSDEIETMTVLVIGRSCIDSRVGEMRAEYHLLAQNAEHDSLLTFCDVQFLDIKNLMDENIQLGHLSKLMMLIFWFVLIHLAVIYWRIITSLSKMH